MEQFVRHGWRFLGLKPAEVLSLTHREFTILAQENEERIHDKNEQEAMYAIMYAAAERGKGKKGKLPKVQDLYNRDGIRKESDQADTIEDMVEKQEHTKKWLEQFDLSEFNVNLDEGR